jgi:N-acyl-D-amino-acid deacylase
MDMNLPWKYLALAVATCSTTRAAEFDFIVTGGQVIDGSGQPAVVSNIGIKDGRITRFGDFSPGDSATIDAAGKYVAPGFIDVHTHSEKVADLPAVENFLRMGVTTIITGNCGSSRVDVAKFFKELDETKLSLHVATLIGHNSVREKAMGGSFMRPPSEAQLSSMCSLVDQAMKDGAVGLSTGLIYLPGTFAKTGEIVSLAKVAADHDGIYASHIRSETHRIFGALDEFLTVAREAKIPAELSHIKLSGPSAWGKAHEVLALLDKARAEGLTITHDQYAYTASSTSLGQLIPDAAREGKRSDFAERIADPIKKAEIAAKMKTMLSGSGRKSYDYAVIAHYRHDPSINGQSVPKVAKLWHGSDDLNYQIDTVLEIEKQGGASAVFHGMNEADLRIFLQHPLTMIASDGNPRKLGDAVPHPRSYGNNARVLARYVRDEKLLTVEDAIRRMTSLPAQTFRLKGKGKIEVGADADLVIFDLQKVADPSTFDDPHHYAEGFRDVLVKGVPVIREGKLTDARPGGALRR